MPQKKYGPGGPARPVEFSPTQVEAFAAGRGVESSVESPRPRDLSDEDVKALAAGSDIGLPTLPTLALKGIESPEESPRPRDLSDEDVKALAAGKDIDLEARAPLKVDRA